MLYVLMNRTGRGKKWSLILTGRLPRVHFSVYEVMFILVREYFLCYPKKFKAIIGKNLISVNLLIIIYIDFIVWMTRYVVQNLEFDSGLNVSAHARIARLTLYLDARIHLGRREFSFLYITIQHFMCIRLCCPQETIRQQRFVLLFYSIKL